MALHFGIFRFSKNYIVFVSVNSSCCKYLNRGKVRKLLGLGKFFLQEIGIRFYLFSIFVQFKLTLYDLQRPLKQPFQSMD